MDYNETIEYLFNQYPAFQNVGSDAYKPGLDRTLRLDELLNHPHKSFKTIHIGGTNGKGSCSHALAAVLQTAGYKVGLYTSPHLIDFRERIRINGEMIDECYVVDFISRHKKDGESIGCSFFELTMMMAFSYFEEQKVDVAVVEVGLGGLLDSTNIIHPVLSIITSISKDHTQFLGETLEEIAEQKAGIIKKETPVIIGNVNRKFLQIFQKKAKEVDAPIYFSKELNMKVLFEKGEWIIELGDGRIIHYGLKGYAQKDNIYTIIAAIILLREIGFNISFYQLGFGLGNIQGLTGLRGRWEIMQEASPKIICDTGHNIGGMEYIVEQLKREQQGINHIIIGFAKDKDLKEILEILPIENTVYYFVNAKSKRSLPSAELMKLARNYKLKGNSYTSVIKAFDEAKKMAQDNDCIFVGGSNFVVGEFLSKLTN